MQLTPKQSQLGKSSFNCPQSGMVGMWSFNMSSKLESVYIKVIILEEPHEFNNFKSYLLVSKYLPSELHSSC